MPTLEQEIEARARVIERAVRAKFGLIRELSEAYALIAAAIEIVLGQPAPNIIRGAVTARRQRQLFQLWLAGDSRVSFRPARQSWHLDGRALDADRNSPTFPAFRRGWSVVARDTGRDGVSFGDEGHFDMPGDRLPPPAF